MKVVNKRFHKQTENDVYIGRPSPLGNPYTHKQGTKADYIVESREKAIELYETYLRVQIADNNELIINELNKLNEDSVLICWCKPASCHGDIIMKIWEEMNAAK